MIVCDTGPLVALSNVRDDYYVSANDLFRDVHVPWVREIATFDRRHLSSITPKNGGNFTLLPESL